MIILGDSWSVRVLRVVASSGLAKSPRSSVARTSGIAQVIVRSVLIISMIAGVASITKWLFMPLGRAISGSCFSFSGGRMR